MHLDQIISYYKDHPMHKDLEIDVDYTQGKAQVGLTVHKSILNLVGILHGAIYFKLIDDACFFAGLSLNKSNFIATSSMSIHYLKPVSKGRIIADAAVVDQVGKKYVCEAAIQDLNGVKYAFGSGMFIEPKGDFDYSRFDQLSI